MLIKKLRKVTIDSIIMMMIIIIMIIIIIIIPIIITTQVSTQVMAVRVEMLTDFWVNVPLNVPP